MQNRKKILFVLPNLCAGGAERVLSFVSQKLNTNNFDVKLIVLGFKKDAVYNVNEVEVQYLNKERLLTSIIALFCLFKKEKPSIVISSIVHVNITMGFFSLFFREIKFVGREASVISKMNEFSKLNSKLNLTLIKIFYPRLSAIICQSEDMKTDFIKILRLDSSKLVLIHNPVTQSFISALSNNFGNKINFITVGRLSEEKGYLRILEGLSKIYNYDFHYTIVGSGPQLEDLKDCVSNYKLNGKVSFIPYTSKVLEEVSKNDFFLQGSYVEGFPNALLESCTVGTPVIAFNCPGGTKDIVITGANGFLVQDELEFIAVLNNIDKLKTIDKNAVRMSVSSKFNAEKIVRKYENLFEQL
ncbi:glycosyltransferase [Flavobacterium hydrophilum]|nr:glycosyltransferase [Flavobacterium hydrophilum]